MEYTVINYLFDKGETVSEGICFTSQSKVTGLNRSRYILDLINKPLTDPDFGYRASR